MRMQYYLFQSRCDTVRNSTAENLQGPNLVCSAKVERRTVATLVEYLIYSWYLC